MRRDAMKLAAGVVMAGVVVACGGDKKNGVADSAPKSDSTPVTDTAVANRASPFSKDKFEVTRTKCTAGQTEFDVDAWAVSTTPGATVQWINRQSNDATITITPKNSAQWPFTDSNAITLAPGATVPKQVVADTTNKGKKFRFIVQIACPGASGHVIKIDPDVFVD